MTIDKTREHIYNLCIWQRFNVQSVQRARNTQQQNNPAKKFAQDQSRHFSEDKRQVINKYILKNNVQ